MDQTYDITKDLGSTHYENKFINRTNNSKRTYGHRSAGNSTSISYSRPTRMIENYRKFDLGPNKEICKNIIIDFKEPVTRSMYRKSILPQSVHFEEKSKTNLQEHFKYRNQKIKIVCKMLNQK